MRAGAAAVVAGAYVRSEERAEPLGEALPLLGVQVLAEVWGIFTRVVMRQSFRNADGRRSRRCTSSRRRRRPR